jgi:glutamate racemase
MQVIVFDSGVGGLSVLDAIVAAGLPVRLDFIADQAWLPYGDKPAEALSARVAALLEAGAGAFQADLVVIACNTASTIALEATRARLSVPVVGVVPPIKPAAEASQTGVIGVLATAATAERPYTLDLIARHGADKTVIRVGATALVAAAEDRLAGRPVPDRPIREAISALFDGPAGDRLDAVALSCTHFPLLVDLLAAAAPRPIAWIDSGPAIARRVAHILGLPFGGAPRFGRAAFTGSEAGRSVWPAFAARGFDQRWVIDDPPYTEGSYFARPAPE